MDNKLVMISIAAVIGILVLGSVLMPILDDATTTEDKFTNTGVYVMTDDLTDGYVLDYRGTTGDFYVNDELVVNRSEIPGGSWTIISTPDWLFRLQNYSAQSFNLWMIGINGTNIVVGNNINPSTQITVTDSTIQVGTADPVSYTGAFRGLAKTGGYVMTNGSPFTVSDTDSIIAGNGTTLVDHWYDFFYLYGTVDSMAVIGPAGITISDITVNSTSLTKYVDGSTVASITFTATGGGDLVNATYDRVIVPSEVTLERAVHFTDGQNAIFAAIPVMIILAILLGVVALVIRSRMD